MSVPTRTMPGVSKAGRTLSDGPRRMSDEIFITLLVAAVAAVLFVIASLLVPNFFQLQNMINFVTNNWAVISLGVGVTFLKDLQLDGFFFVDADDRVALFFAQEDVGDFAETHRLAVRAPDD